jgi:hypothetical protein
MLNFAEQTGSGAVMLVWSFLSTSNLKKYQYNGRIQRESFFLTQTNTTKRTMAPNDLDGTYSYQERVLLSPAHNDNHDAWNVRLESFGKFDHTTWIHPFHKRITGFFDSFPQVVRLLIQVASHPSQEFPLDGLDIVPPMSYISSKTTSSGADTLPSPHLGPSGVWIVVHVDKHLELDLLFLGDLRAQVSQLVIAPLGTTPWDIVYHESGDNDPKAYNVLQMFLPTNGAAISSDALQQSFVQFNPCTDAAQFDKSGVGIFQNATALSQILLGGSGASSMRSVPLKSRRSLWLELGQSAETGRRTFSQGVQYALQSVSTSASLEANEWSHWALPGTTLKTCVLCDAPLQAQVVQHHPRKEEEGAGYTLVSPSAAAASHANAGGPPTTSYFSLAKVARRPQGVAYRGRLETTFENNHADCQAHITLRDIIPSFLTPVWQSLHINQPSATVSVEWRGDDTAQLLVELTRLEPHTSLVVSLDYEAVFLPFQDFPGDPNRGMEVSPAILEWKCLSPEEATAEPHHYLYSNTLLILPPVPDMSMPFNVTSLSCSLYAYVFGSLVAMLVKRSSERIRFKLHPDQRPKSKLGSLKERIGQKLRQVQSKLKGIRGGSRGGAGTDSEKEEKDTNIDDDNNTSAEQEEVGQTHEKAE